MERGSQTGNELGVRRKGAKVYTFAPFRLKQEFSCGVTRMHADKNLLICEIRVYPRLKNNLAFGIFAFTRSGGLGLRKRHADGIGFSLKLFVKCRVARIADNHFAGLF